MKRIYVKFSLFVLFASMVAPLAAKLERTIVYRDPEKRKDKNRLFAKFKDLDIAAFQNDVAAANLTNDQMEMVLDTFLDTQEEVRDIRDKVLFLAGKVKNKDGYTLLWAYDKQDRPLIKKLRALGYNISDALLMAVQMAGADLIPALLKDGARVNRRVIERAIPNAEFHMVPSFDPKHFAPKDREMMRKRHEELKITVAQGNRESRKLRALLPQLLKRLKNVNERDAAGRTLLFRVRDKELADILLKAGVDINAQDHEDETFLWRMVYIFPTKDKENTPEEIKRHEELIAYLVQQGADPYIKDKDGDSALSLAKKNGFTDLVTLFEGSKTAGRAGRR